MKKLVILPLCLCATFVVQNLHAAADFKQSKVTQVVNDVQIISAASQSQKAATVNDVFKMPDILKTGPSSRAELVAEDETVTRVGANTIFSFDPAKRTVDLKQGSLLFHSPHGKGGGTIHTGSATASVLGSTLIVTTTASGGFKVLALEDEAEITFLNGLKKTLQPGQMTFVLPGGNGISPIIIFRLDDLIGTSQLIKGFNQSLPSLPLIQKEIDNQNKDIKNGKLEDTHKGVGDDANDKQVQVIDLNTLQQQLAYKNPVGADAALLADALIDQPSLTDASIPTPPQRIFVDKPFLLKGNPFYFGQPFVGFAARDITFQLNSFIPARVTPSIVVITPTLHVDISPYANLPEFDIVASRDINILDSVTFVGLSESSSIFFSLVAGRQFNIASGITIRADAANFELQSPALLSLDEVNVLNEIGNTSFGVGLGMELQNSSLQTGGNLAIRSGGAVSFTDSTLFANSALVNSLNSQLTFDHSTAALGDFGVFSAKKDVTLNASVINADTTSGQLFFISKSGSVNITCTSIQAYYLTVNSGDGILLDGSGGQSFIGTQANFAAANNITMNNADLSGYSKLNAAANTITVRGCTFGLAGI